MQRVRIGLTGLASVFLLVLLGAIFVKFVREGEAARHVVSRSGAAVHPGPDLPKEPLAELGITPGNAPQPANSSGQIAPPAP